MIIFSVPTAYHTNKATLMARLEKPIDYRRRFSSDPETCRLGETLYLLAPSLVQFKRL